MTAPTLTTDRLTLRPLRYEDFPAFAAFLASDRSRHMGGPYDHARAWLWFCSDAGQWALFGHGALMIDLADGATVGQVGINHGPLFPERELGWFLYAGHEGRGYATEAAAALRDWGFGTQGYETLVSYMDPANQASARVARRLGAVPDPAAAVQDAGDIAYRHSPGGRA